jgi:hypothetical protein
VFHRSSLTYILAEFTPTKQWLTEVIRWIFLYVFYFTFCHRAACAAGASGTLRVIATDRAMAARCLGATVVIKPVTMFVSQTVSLWVQLSQ